MTKRQTPWKYELLDINEVDEKFKIINHDEVSKLVRAVGEKAAAIVGGIRVYKEDSYARKSR